MPAVEMGVMPGWVSTSPPSPSPVDRGTIGLSCSSFMKLLFEFPSPVTEARLSMDWTWSCPKSHYGWLVPTGARHAVLPLPVQSSRGSSTVR